MRLPLFHLPGLLTALHLCFALLPEPRGPELLSLIRRAMISLLSLSLFLVDFLQVIRYKPFLASLFALLIKVQ